MEDIAQELEKLKKELVETREENKEIRRLLQHLEGVPCFIREANAELQELKKVVMDCRALQGFDFVPKDDPDFNVWTGLIRIDFGLDSRVFGWYLGCHDWFDFDRRDENSLRAIFMRSRSKAAMWKTVPCGDGTHFLQLVQNGDSSRIAVDYYLNVSREYKLDRREEHTTYVSVGRKALTGWLLVKSGDFYLMKAEKNNEPNVKEGSHYLAAHRHYIADRRDGCSVYAMVTSMAKHECVFELI